MEVGTREKDGGNERKRMETREGWEKEIERGNERENRWKQERKREREKI